MTNLHRKMKLLHSKQTQWAILRYTYAYPKFMNIFRTVPKYYLKEFIQYVDEAAMDMVAYVLDYPLNAEQMIQVQLPFNHGGMGIMTIKKTTLKPLKLLAGNR